mmetsp:Transcript_48945/g.116531  ORF Transcript_48945/g.116531 Transcript_48945/m.116531 type:complete len:1449 (-) Transcript_48945:78-4424(-)
MQAAGGGAAGGGSARPPLDEEMEEAGASASKRQRVPTNHYRPAQTPPRGVSAAGAAAQRSVVEDDTESDSEEEGIAFTIDGKLTPRENAIAFTTQLQEKWGVVSEDVPWAHHFEGPSAGVASLSSARKKAILAGIGKVAAIIDGEELDSYKPALIAVLLLEEGALDLAVAKCFHGGGEWDPKKRAFQGAPDWDSVLVHLANLKGAASDSEDLEHLPYHQKAINDAAKAAGETLREPRKPFSLALLGNNGEGKSLTTNIILDMSSVLAFAYEKNLKNLSAAQFKKVLIDQGEAVQKLQEMPNVQAALKASPFPEDLSKVLEIDESKIRLLEEEVEGSDAWVEMDEKREEEKEQEKLMAYACRKPLSTVTGTLLPSKAESKSTTRVAIRVGHGTVFHGLVIFKSVEHIKTELCNFDFWVEDATSDEDVKRQRRGMIQRLRLLEGGNTDLPDEMLDENDDDSSIVLPTRDNIVIHPRLLTIIEDATHPFKNGGGEVAFEIFAGNGKNMLYDRMAVRERIDELQSDVAVACIIDSIHIFCPSDILQGLEIVDCPGTGTEDPLEHKALSNAVESADGVMLVMQRNLSTTKDVKEFLKEAGVIKKWIENKEFPLLLLHALNEASGRPLLAAHTLPKWNAKLQNDRINAQSGSIRSFTGMISEELKKAKKPADKGDIQPFIDRITEDMLFVMPVQTASIMKTEKLLVKDDKDKRELRILTPEERTKLLEDMHGDRLLQRLVNLHTPDRLSDVLMGLKKEFGNLHQALGLDLHDHELERCKTEGKRTWKKAKDENEQAELTNNCREKVFKRDIWDRSISMDDLEKTITGVFEMEEDAGKEVVEHFKKKKKMSQLKNIFSETAEGCAKGPGNGLMRQIFLRVPDHPLAQTPELLPKIMADAASKLEMNTEHFLVKHVQAKLSQRGVAMSEALSSELAQIVKECIENDGKMTALLTKLRDSGKKNFKLAVSAKKSIMEELVRVSAGFNQPAEYYSLLENKLSRVLKVAGNKFQEEVGNNIFAELAEAKERVLCGTWTNSRKKKRRVGAIILRLYTAVFTKLQSRAEGCKMRKGDTKTIGNFTKASDSLLLTIAKDKKSTTWILDTIKSRILHSRISQLCQGEAPTLLGKPTRTNFRIAIEPGAKEAKDLLERTRAAQRGLNGKVPLLEAEMHTVCGAPRGWVLGSVPADGNALFRTLVQCLGHAGKRESKQTNLAGMLRTALIQQAVQRCLESQDATTNFAEVMGEDIQTWTDKVKIDHAWGDVAFIDAFARFYNVSVYLFIQESDGFGPPWKFPAEAAFGERKGVGGEVRFAIAQVKINDAAASHFVPLWRKGVKLDAGSKSGCGEPDSRGFWVAPPDAAPSRSPAWEHEEPDEERALKRQRYGECKANEKRNYSEAANEGLRFSRGEFSEEDIKRKLDADAQGLPPGWAAAWSTTRKKVYYYQTSIRGSSTFCKPQ